MELHKEIKKINSKEDFLNFVSLLAKDFKDNNDEWENRSVESYLEAMQSWVEDMDGYYENNHLPIPNKVDWSFFANVLYAGKIYE